MQAPRGAAGIGGALASRLRAWAAMRLAVLLLLAVATCACAEGMAPGVPLTDISATNTESTGPFEVIERRTDERGRLRLKVRAARPEAAEEVARRVLYRG